MAGPLDNMTPEQLLAATSSGNDFETLAPGYVQDKRTGIVYRNGEPVDPAEANQAIINYHSAVAAAGRAPAQPTPHVDERTGELVMISPDGSIKRTGYFPSFPGIDPLDKQAREDQITAFNQAQVQRQDVINQVDTANKNVLAIAGMEEQARQSGLDREAANWRAELSSAVQQYTQAMSLIPQLGQLSIAESQQVASIMQNGGDFIARSFASSGAKAPGAPVLQADQINTLRTQTNQVRQMIGDSLRQAAQAMNSAYANRPGQDTGFRAPTLQDYSKAPPLMPAGFQKQAPAPTYQTTPEYLRSQGVPEWAIPGGQASASGGGGFAGQPTGGVSYTGGGSPNPPLNPDTTPYWAQPDVQGTNGSVASTGGQASGGRSVAVGSGLNSIANGVGGFLQGIGGSLATGGTGSRPFAISPEYSTDTNGTVYRTEPAASAPSQQAPASDNGWNANLPVQNNGGGGFWDAKYLPQYAPGPDTGPGLAGGGFTNASHFLGNEKGAELFLNPTNAPIGVVKHSDTKKIIAGKRGFPRYATGTGVDYTANLPDIQMSPMTSQSELVANAMANSSPRINAAFNGTPITPRFSLPSTIDNTQFLRPFTSRQLGSLTSEETQALGSRANVGFNAPLSYLQNQTQELYAPETPTNALYSRWFSGFTGARGLGQL